MTLFWLSRTGREVIPSLCISSSASVTGLSPLFRMSEHDGLLEAEGLT